VEIIGMLPVGLLVEFLVSEESGVRSAFEAVLNAVASPVWVVEYDLIALIMVAPLCGIGTRSNISLSCMHVNISNGRFQAKLYLVDAQSQRPIVVRARNKPSRSTPRDGLSNTYRDFCDMPKILAAFIS
jgi:hypothetical protein